MSLNTIQLILITDTVLMPIANGGYMERARGKQKLKARKSTKLSSSLLSSQYGNTTENSQYL